MRLGPAAGCGEGGVAGRGLADRRMRRTSSRRVEDIRFLWIRIGLAVVTGVCWALSFPLPNLAGFAWAVPGLLMFLGVGLARGLWWRTLYGAGVVHYLISLSWLRHIPFPVGAYTGWCALSLFLALFPPLWVGASWRFGKTLGVCPPASGGLLEVGDALARVSGWRLNGWLVVSAAVWVTWEMVLARVFGGFPWNLLGVSQYRILPLIQVAAVTGVYGVSFLVAWFGVSIATTALLMACHPRRPALWPRPLVWPALMLALTITWGFLAMRDDSPPPRRLSIALVQPGIPQTMIFDPAEATNRFEKLLALTQQALARKPEVVVWPEASLPGDLSAEEFQRVITAVRGAGAWFVFGADDDVEETGPDDGPVVHAYNTAFLVNPAGKITARYRKRRLVMFGEYIPFGRWLPILQRLAPIGEGMEAGQQPVAFHLDTLGATTSALICFEDNFPQQAREHAAPGTDFLLNLTNDAWFGRSAAQWQHAANASFRAIENGMPLVRCANNGLSCWIDRRGRLHSPRLEEGRNVYDAGFDVVTVGIGDRDRTLYNRWGDVFGWSCVGVTLVGLARGWRGVSPKAGPTPAP